MRCQREQCGRNSPGAGSTAFSLALLGSFRPGVKPSPKCKADLQVPQIRLSFHSMPHAVSIVGLSQRPSESVDSFEFLCSNITFINMQLMQSSSLFFHWETAWHKLEKISSLPVLFDVVQLFQSFSFSVCFCLCVIWSVKCQYYFILLFNKTFSFLHFSPCAFLISIIFPLCLRNYVKERWLSIKSIWDSSLERDIFLAVSCCACRGTWAPRAIQAGAVTHSIQMSHSSGRTYTESLWSEECSLGNLKTERWEGNIISLI